MANFHALLFCHSPKRIKNKENNFLKRAKKGSTQKPEVERAASRNRL